MDKCVHFLATQLHTIYLWGWHSVSLHGVHNVSLPVDLHGLLLPSANNNTEIYFFMKGGLHIQPMQPNPGSSTDVDAVEDPGDGDVYWSHNT
ncbi:MAG: hypothetical protein A6F71_07515 [Cycloclasticus sp. symbiont of Poecilosclerida sp. M]|nr:MAG: hypothetical protein A6F71_07515 [Cycloclasticus sp. symbiont of Poecilosclerida sp. M]